MIESYEKYKKIILDMLDYSIAYYNESPKITDFEYDMLYRSISEYERNHPSDIYKYSPTQLVGASIHEGPFQKFKHKEPMLSLDNSFDESDVEKFIKKVNHINPFDTVMIQPKIDGVAISLHYENGELVKGVTRGDGEYGEDITNNLIQCTTIPKHIPIMDEVEVRGEAYIPKEKFIKINEALDESGKKIYANPRNLASGTLKSLDPLETKNRGIKFIAYYLSCTLPNIDIDTEEKSITILKHVCEFSTPLISIYDTKNIKDIMFGLQLIKNQRDYYAFEIDGAVIKVNNKITQKEMGATSHAPSWAIAFKYPPEEKESRLLDIEWNVGRTGKITPVGILEPVALSGSVVSRVSLHNQDFIDSVGLKIGACVKIRKAAEIIPEIISVTKEGNIEIIFPTKCPVCGGCIIRIEGEAAHRCINNNCPAQLEESIKHLVSRKCLDIRGMGDVIVKKCVQDKLITKRSDIGILDKNKLSKCIGSEIIAQKIIQEIEESKNRPFEHLLAGMGILGVGIIISKLLVSKFHNINNLNNASIEDFKKLDGIGDIIATQLFDYFQDLNNMEEFILFEKMGWKTSSEKSEEISNALEGFSFVITGTLSKPRDWFEKYIIDRGGKVSSSVSKKTNYLLCGQNPGGTKYNKAKELNIPMIAENDLRKLGAMRNMSMEITPSGQTYYISNNHGGCKMINEFKGKYDFLSNFYHAPFTYNGNTYSTVEHYFQANKTTNKQDFEKIISAKTPAEAKALGCKVKLREDWDRVKNNIMFQGVYSKFNQNEDIKYKLISTYSHTLKEGNNWGDTYWGVDLKTGEGTNMLGRILMRCRELFIN